MSNKVEGLQPAQDTTQEGNNHFVLLLLRVEQDKQRKQINFRKIFKARFIRIRFSRLTQQLRF
jgi:hypothetical protein